MHLLELSRRDAQDAWARGEYTDENPQYAAVKNAAALGGIRVVDQVIDVVESYKALNESGEKV